MGDSSAVGTEPKRAAEFLNVFYRTFFYIFSGIIIMNSSTPFGLAHQPRRGPAWQIPVQGSVKISFAHYTISSTARIR